MRAWASPYLTNDSIVSKSIDLPKNLRDLARFGATVETDEISGSRFVVVTLTLGISYEALFIGENNATIGTSRVLIRKWADGIFYVYDAN